MVNVGNLDLKVHPSPERVFQGIHAIAAARAVCLFEHQVDGSAGKMSETLLGTFKADTEPESVHVEAQGPSEIGDVQFGNHGRCAERHAGVYQIPAAFTWPSARRRAQPNRRHLANRKYGNRFTISEMPAMMQSRRQSRESMSNPKIIGAGICARAPCSRSSFVRTERKICRNALKPLVGRKENDARAPVFRVSRAGVFETKSARLAHKRALSRWPHAEERPPTWHLEGEFRERPRRRLLAGSEAVFDASRRRTRSWNEMRSEKVARKRT